MGEFIIVIAFVLLAVGVFFAQKRKKKSLQPIMKATGDSVATAEDAPIAIALSASRISKAEKIEIANLSGGSLTLARLDSSTALSTRKFQEITAHGTAIGASLAQAAMPALAQAQTLAEIANAAPNGLFAATAPLTELMKYKDGTIGSIVVKGKKIAGKAGFKEIALSAANPAVAVGAGMQAMAMISGQYYMDKISKQLDGIEHGIERLIEFHHDESIGKLLSIEHRMKEILRKKHVDETDIIALQSGIREADSVLMEYSTRLERLSKTGKLTEVHVRALWSRFSASKELKSLSANTEHELYYSFQICLLANRLMLESKKAEFATRMKIGETEKAIESFEAFNAMHQQSFIANAPEYLDSIFNPISDKAESLIKRQWIESKKAKGELESIGAKKEDLLGLVPEDDSYEEMIRIFTKDSEILYLPLGDDEAPRMFISARDEALPIEH
jgi:hypothetical protein